MKITEWPTGEDPQDKLLRFGAQTFSDAELLAILFRNGYQGMTAFDLSRHALNHFGGIRSLLMCEKDEFCQLKGLGPVKFTLIKAVRELSNRFLAEKLLRNEPLTSVADTRKYLINQLRDARQEIFALLLLDTQHTVIEFIPLFRGTIDSATVHPREVVKVVLDYNASAVILAHNHPSGVAEPSFTDVHITNVLTKALALIDVQVLDHFVIGDGQVVSFAERGIL